jgi:hypothetical protein
MPSTNDYSAQSLELRLRRLGATPDELAQAIQGRSDALLSRRPEPKSWSAKEVVCHLRDIEELCILRFHMMLVMDEPKVLVAGDPPRGMRLWGMNEQVPFPLDPDRWAEERQYNRNDTVLALSAFRRRRQEVLIFFERLSPDQWSRGCIHPSLGRITFADWTIGMAHHDDSHVRQLQRALAK